MATPLIDVKSASYIYDEGFDDALLAVDDMTFQLMEGEHLAILGRNGSGKSTLAKLLNALLLPQKGKVIVLGFDSSDEEHLWDIRSQLGMVFQNPDNQIVATTVEEDVAFGLENLGIPLEEMKIRVPQALEQVGLTGLEKRQPSELSGGQKQKLAVAGIIAMNPSCIILDEATAMLDPKSRKELLNLVEKVQEQRKLSIINVTHHMDEVLRADRVILMSQGKAVLSGKPHEIFFQTEELRSLGLDVPTHVAVARKIAETLKCSPTSENLATEEAALDYIIELLCSDDAEIKEEIAQLKPAVDVKSHLVQGDRNDPIIQVENLSFTYNPDRQDAVQAIQDVSFELRRGEFLGIAGHTGSGKSTLIQHLNGLIKTQKGSIRVFQKNPNAREDIPEIRKRVGMVFQYPEQQLFAETIYDDVSYGPKRLGHPEEEIKINTMEALRLVGLSDMDTSRSPFELSGGQMRRVAIAGILAMKPDVLILDEPAAGLDPQGREEIFDTILELQREGVSIIFVSHSMDDLARLCDRIMILKDGKLQKIGSVAEIFSDKQFVIDNNLEVPALMRFALSFKKHFPKLDPKTFTVDSLVASLFAEAKFREVALEGETPNA